jgi:hypothetical protein
MTTYALDSDSLTLLRRAHPELSRRFLATDPLQRATTVITVEEALTGWYAAIRKPQPTARLA